MSAFEARVSLDFALASQTSSLSQRLLMDLATETAKYVFPKRFESQNLEEALMAVPDLESVKFKVLRRRDQYEIREVEPYFIAETTMPGKAGFDFNGASQYFNVLAEHLFEYNKGDNGNDYPCYHMQDLVGLGENGNDMTCDNQEGFVTDEEVKRRELELRDALKDDRQFQVKEGTSVEVAQYNPPFTLPFTRRNEIALEVERKEE